MTAAGPVVSLLGVTKRFGEVTAVDDVSLEVAPGELLALLGPSGCGKTTTLRMIAGFEEPTAGDIRIDGASAAGVPPHRRAVNTVFQDYALFPHMSVVDNVAYGLRQRRVPRAERRRRAAAALELVRLPGMERRRPTELSGGQRQRVALARALVLSPTVLLLDEPLGALDLKLRKAMQIELKRIQGKVGITFVLVTHDQDEAMALADRVAVMHAGRIEQLDAPQAVYDRPATAFVADFIGDMNHLSGRLLDAGAVELSGGAVVRPGRALEDPPAGADVLVGVRPEDVHLSTNGAGVQATVRTSMVVGPQVQILVRLPTGAEVLLRQPRGDVAVLEPGAAVRVAWDPAALVLLGAAPC